MLRRGFHKNGNEAEMVVYRTGHFPEYCINRLNPRISLSRQIDKQGILSAVEKIYISIFYEFTKYILGGESVRNE